MAKLPYIEIGYPVFAGDGVVAFGAVRDIVPDGRPVLIVYVEGSGDVDVPLDAVIKVAARRVVIDAGRLDEALQRAIRRSHDEEDFPPDGEPEVDLEPASYDDEDGDEPPLKPGDGEPVTRPRGGT